MDPDVAKAELVEIHPIKKQKTLSEMYGSVKQSFVEDGNYLTEIRIEN